MFGGRASDAPMLGLPLGEQSSIQTSSVERKWEDFSPEPLDLIGCS